MKENVGTNLVTHQIPMRDICLHVQLFSGFDTAIKCNPTHHFRVDKVTWLATHLPDAAIGFLPVSAYMFYEHVHHIPQWAIQFFIVEFEAALTAIDVDAIQQVFEE